VANSAPTRSSNCERSFFTAAEDDAIALTAR
jgi:hypothetical protein